MWHNDQTWTEIIRWLRGPVSVKFGPTYPIKVTSLVLSWPLSRWHTEQKWLGLEPISAKPRAWSDFRHKLKLASKFTPVFPDFCAVSHRFYLLLSAAIRLSVCLPLFQAYLIDRSIDYDEATDWLIRESSLDLLFNAILSGAIGQSKPSVSVPMLFPVCVFFVPRISI